MLTRLAGRLAPSLADLVFLGCFFVALGAGSTMISADGDPGRHLTVGRAILAAGAIPRVDVFSHTLAGEPFVPYEWLAEVLIAASHAAAGLAGAVLLHAAVIAVSFALLYCQLRRRGHGALLALAVTLLAAAVSAIHWLARPHVFTFLGVAVFAAVLDGWQRGRLSSRWLWLLPPSMLVWTNVHGGFLVGFVLLGVYAIADGIRAALGTDEMAEPARRRLRQLAAPVLASFLATLLNPAGPALWQHVTGYFGKSLLVDLTDEYRSPSLHDPSVRGFYAMLALSAVGLAVSRRRLALQELGLFLVFGAFALYAARNIPLYAIVVAPCLATSVEGIDLRMNAGARARHMLARLTGWLAARDAAYTRIDGRAAGHALPAMAVALTLAGAVATRNGASLGVEIDAKRQPAGALAYLKAHPPQGKVFNELVWGGYVLHELWPAQRVFIDGQTDFYGEALTAEYLSVRAAEVDWSTTLDRRGIDWVLLPPDAPLARTLQGTAGWRTAYADRVAVVLTRDAPRDAPITRPAPAALDTAAAPY